MVRALFLGAMLGGTTQGAPVDPALPAYQPRDFERPPPSAAFRADGSIAVVGYNDMQEMLEAIDARFVRSHPGFTFVLDLRGTRTAPPALARGDSAFAPMGAEFSAAELADYRRATGREPLAFRVAHASLSPRALSGPLAIIVHPQSPRETISLGALAELFLGRGHDPNLRPCGLGSDTALGLFFRQRVLQGGDFSSDYQAFAQSAAVVSYVAGHPGAIGFAAAVRADASVKILALEPEPAAAPIALTEENVAAGRYPLDRHLLIYAAQPLSPLVREYLRLVLSREGQALIGAGTRGYLPLNAQDAAAERAKLD